MAVTAADHPILAMFLFNLGRSLQARAERGQVLTDRDEAIGAYAAAARVAFARPSIRIRAARSAATLAAARDVAEAARLLETAVRLLPETTPRQLERSDQQYVLGVAAGLAGDAAALTLAADPADDVRPARALQLLELGRAVLLSQALETRSDLTDLQERHPKLARRFVNLRDALDQPTPLLDDSGLQGSAVDGVTRRTPHPQGGPVR